MEEPVMNPPRPPSSEPSTKKRPLENDAVSHKSKQYKLRVILRDLRPHFLEVLRTPDFRNCKAADEIREKMKLLIELFSQKEMPENKEGQSPEEKLQDVAAAGHSPSEKPSTETGDSKGTYIIGGSAFGWNFVTFLGKDPVYYGVTKDTFRANNATSIVTPPQSH